LIRSRRRFNTQPEQFDQSLGKASQRRFSSTTLLCLTCAAVEHHVKSGMAWSTNKSHPSKNRTTSSSISESSTIYSNLLSIDGGLSNGGSYNNNISSNLIWHHITEPIGSTQDEIRRLLKQQQQQKNIRNNKKAIAVLADIQLDGRGTQGRKWEMGDVVDDPIEGDGKPQKDDNLYMTVGIPLDSIPITITLLPLQIGVFVAERVSQLIQLCQARPIQDPVNAKHGDTYNLSSEVPKVTVKWPNDVLVDQRKVSGTLIETESIAYNNSSPSLYTTSWMLIGIGINVATAPRNLLLRDRAGKHTRAPCCIQDFCRSASHNGNHNLPAPKLPPHTAFVLGQDLASAIVDWISNDDTTTDKTNRDEQLLQKWRSYAEWGVQYELRGRVIDEEHGGYEGEKVTTVDIEQDGQLRVRGADGRERLLVADYLF
jgi:BirA family transcriptional regulator, biotin operon repressor / biotin---[acetyl-CoA-carboxylase] ligase